MAEANVRGKMLFSTEPTLVTLGLVVKTWRRKLEEVVAQMNTAVSQMEVAKVEQAERSSKSKLLSRPRHPWS